MTLQQPRKFSATVPGVRHRGLDRLVAHRPPAVMSPLLVNEWSVGDGLGGERILGARVLSGEQHEPQQGRLIGGLDV